MTARGMPQIYAGDEIAMPGGDDHDDRRDFSGGFPATSRAPVANAFTAAGRTPEQQSMFTWVQQLATLRHDHPALACGAARAMAAQLAKPSARIKPWDLRSFSSIAGSPFAGAFFDGESLHQHPYVCDPTSRETSPTARHHHRCHHRRLVPRAIRPLADGECSSPSPTCRRWRTPRWTPACRRDKARTG